MQKKFYIINPAPPKKTRRSSSKKKRTVKNAAPAALKLGTKKGGTMAVTRKRRKTTRRAKKNPITVVTAGPKRKRTAARVTYINPRKPRIKKRYRRNPDSTVSVSLDPLKAQNALQYGAGAVAGVFVPQIIGNMLGFSGNAKYLTQAGIGVAGYIAAKKLGMPKAGLAFLISSIAITAMEFSMDYGIMQGAHTLLGVPYAPPRLNGMVPRMNGMIPAGQPLRGIVPFNQPSRISGQGAYSGYDN